jgi:hypothetical protein
MYFKNKKDGRTFSFPEFCYGVMLFVLSSLKYLSLKYDKQDQQGKAAFNERNPHTTQWQGAQADPTKTGHDTDRLITKMINDL